MFELRDEKLTLTWPDALYLATSITRCNCIPRLYIDSPKKDKNLVLMYALAVPWSHECRYPLIQDEEEEEDE